MPSTSPLPNHDGGCVSTMNNNNHTPRPTYSQDWPRYNEAQFREEELFKTLLRDLCSKIEQPPQQGRGRPRLLLADAAFGICLKVYMEKSGRRAMTTLRDAQADGLMDKAPSFSAMFKYLEDPAVTPLLKNLIAIAATPLRTVEVDMAVDSTGFSTSVYRRWFDEKYGRERKSGYFLKAHVMSGVKTNIVTSVDVLGGYTADSPQLPGLLAETAKIFDIREVSADKAYSSHKNLEAITAVGAMPYIPFRDNTVPPLKALDGEVLPIDESVWARIYHYYAFKQAEFKERYHKRSNVEATFSMIKMKFGHAVRAKTLTAQTNEVLAKVLCHNICVLIRSFYELGIDPSLITGQPIKCTEGPVVQKIAAN